MQYGLLRFNFISQVPENPQDVLDYQALLSALPIPNRHCASTNNNSAMLGLCIAAMFHWARDRRIA